MTAIIDDFSEPESWARELAMRPRDVHPALREHAKEHAKLWARVFHLESTLKELRIRYHAAGRRPEECHEMSLIDAALGEKHDRA